MAILKLKPHTTDYLWGGEKLREQYNIKSDKTPLAEAWMLSAHKSGESVIVNTDDKGLTLSEYISKYGKTALGKNCERFENFPVLIKFIDAKDNLSIQVHPSDEYALKNEGEFGKTEMWYILDAEPDAFLYYGFKEEISKDEFVERIENNTLLEVLNAVKVNKGDVFFIPAGTLHAIGKGIVIAEVQQNSNLTYRVYDYGRVDKNGNTRELHVEKSVKVTDLNLPKQLDFGNHLAKCEYFTVDVVEDDFIGVCEENSFVSILVLDGKGEINCKDECLAIQKGDSLFLPANSGEFKLSNVKALITRV
ncbi:MAG: class I mannose-6-phosphate isomerase [Clostridia bacterium]|nr:class I mannose-6-phosphate isomerase [Clostridia bacterium]